MEQSVGIITRLTKLTETSWIVHWCMEQEGLIKTVAKGARRPKSSFSGKLDLFLEADVTWVKSRKSELHALREVAVLDYREGLRKRYVDVMMASYFINLLTLAVEPEHPIPEFYDLLKRGLKYIEEKGGDRRALLHYEREVTRLLGIQHERIAPEISLERAFGLLPRGRSTCLELCENNNK